MILVIFIKFLLRGVLRKTAKFLRTGFALNLTPASVNAIVGRVADAACREYNELKERIRKSDLVYVDETEFFGTWEESMGMDFSYDTRHLACRSSEPG